MPKLSFRIDPLFLILAFGLGWLNSNTVTEIFLWALVIFISILVHELGHALTALSFGQTAEIAFIPIGGLTSRTGPKLNYIKEFLIVLNGPLAGFALYFLCRFLLESHAFESTSSLGYMLLIGSYINLVWTVLNLFPVLPLDGGKLIMILSEKIFGIKGGRIAFGLSFLFAVIFAILFFLMHEIFAGAIFSLFAFESYRGYDQGRFISPIDEDPELKNLIEKGSISYNQGNIAEAQTSFCEIRAKAKEGLLYLHATLYLAKTLEDEQNYDEAYAVLKPEERKLDIDGLEVLQRIAFQSKHYKQAARIGQEVFREKPGPSPALINSLSLAQLKQTAESIGWFETAVREGLDNPLLVSQHLAFEPIRNTPDFKHFISRLKT